MRTKSFIFLGLLLCLFNCDNETATDEFDNVNGDVEDKLIRRITIISGQDVAENRTITFSYNGANQLTNISNLEGAAFFIYNNDELSAIAGDGETFNVEEVILNSPYDAFETGEVISYDDLGNPSIIKFYEEVYDWNNDVSNVLTYTAEITYDTAHNPYFHTMEAAGIIGALDDITLNFGITPQAPELLQARSLLPLKNPEQLTYKNELGEVVFVINADYDYDASNYPTNATIIGYSTEDDETAIYNIEYEYVE